MDLIVFILVTAVFGAVVGALARLALPGPDPMSISQTILVGIGGSFAAGIVVRLLSGGRADAGMIASVLGATGIVYLVRRSRERRPPA